MTLTWRGTRLSGFLEELKVWGYFQNKEDKRRDFDNLKTGKAQTRSYAFDVQGISLIGESHRLTYGVHYSEDHGESPDGRDSREAIPPFPDLPSVFPAFAPCGGPRRNWSGQKTVDL